MVLLIKRLKYQIIAITLVILVLFTIIPVSATYNDNYYVVAPNIHQGATVFIGEQGLNVTDALLTAAGGDTTLTTIAWWAYLSNPYTSPYSRPPFDFDATCANSFTVDDSFAGYTGTWYVVDPATGFALAPVFDVQDPALSLNIWDWDLNADVTGRSVRHGDILGFKVSTNMIDALDGTEFTGHRTPVTVSPAQ